MNEPKVMNSRTCSVEDCTGPVRAKGYCQPHYQRSLRYDGNPLGTFVRKTGQPCPVEERGTECGRPVVARKLCIKHYRRQVRTGSLETTRPPVLPPKAVSAIQQRFKWGDPVNGREALAREFGVSVETVSRILSRPSPVVPQPAPLDPFSD